MSFLSKLFGGSSKAPAVQTAEAQEMAYKGFTIRAAPRKESGQYLVAGTVEKLIDGALKSHDFVRADRSPNLDEIVDMTFQKGRLMIDQQGEALLG